ncbi:choice-of-anchor F family protein [Marinobacter sediminum]|uniref:choice-of-anchor F family protein n=1 Tax=Marinobacter sediminum TaxID=256323 RepID=UPI00202DBD3C|nr:choice-of-anchor F family protein [Marinobacter sediminum]MCM0612443.1 choice-of-anchor F family protein [Marinobacter sediminum]
MEFSRKPLASAIMFSMLGLSQAASAATIDSVNEDNLAVPPVDGKTVVYTDTEGTGSFGWIDPVNDFGNVGLGIKVYNEPFTAKNTYDFAGCIMAQPDRQLVDPDFKNCTAPPDSGKRFKLKSTQANGPTDLVFNVSPGAEPKLYRVIGKLSNLTDGANTAGGDLNGFRFETGFGVGSSFTPSPANDGLSFGFIDESNKLTIGNLGKFPGGLFGGSKAEGLPFFSTSVRGFSESNETLVNEDETETTGTAPVALVDGTSDVLFDDWATKSLVPTGWFIDHDGNPANDSILLAWNAGTEATPDWQTFEKVFEGATAEWDGNVEYDNDGDKETAPLQIPAINWDPNGSSFADPVTAEDNTTTITNYVKDVLPIVETLGEGDAEGVVTDALSLSQIAAADLYDGMFKVLIDGEAVTIADFGQWANTPVTVEDGGSLYATWFPNEGEDGLYQLESDSSWVTLDEMNTLIDGNANLERVAGYVKGPIEDLANVNINTTINVADTFSLNWPTCTSDGVDTNCTFTLRVTALNDAVSVPDIPVTPVEPEEPTEPEATPSSGGGTIFGCTAGKPGAPFDPVLPGLVLMALGGLWARKRLSNA